MIILGIPVIITAGDFVALNFNLLDVKNCLQRWCLCDCKSWFL